MLLGLLIMIGVFAILGWTPDSRDDAQQLRPLDRRARDDPARASRATLPCPMFAPNRVPKSWDSEPPTPGGAWSR